MMSLGQCMLGGVPRVATAVRDDASRSDVERAFLGGGDIVELRIDGFRDQQAAYVRGVLAPFVGMPSIGTIRSKREGGGFVGDEQQRLRLYQEIMPLVDAVDIELGADDINQEVILAAREAGNLTLGSFHEFSATPSIKTLRETVAKGEDLGVDIVKIAAHCEDMDGLRRLAQLLIEFPDKALVVIGMGPRGAASRLLFPALGSLIVYTFLGAPTAPGQFTHEATIELMKRLFGGFP